MKQRFFLLLILLYSCTICMFAQNSGEGAIEGDYTNETAIGLNFNTIGGLFGGINAKHSRQIKQGQYHVFFLELTNVKHAKEDTRPAITSGEVFTPGKTNYLLMLRPHYGREIRLFRPMAEQGLQVNFIGTAGLTFGIEIPYYIEYVASFSRREIVIEPYDPVKHPSFDAVIRGRGIFGEGLSHMNFVAGASAKASLSFRFSSFANNSLGLEGGVLVDYLQRPIQMMATSPSQQFFQSFFLTLFFSFSE